MFCVWFCLFLGDWVMLICVLFVFLLFLCVRFFINFTIIIMFFLSMLCLIQLLNFVFVH